MVVGFADMGSRAARVVPSSSVGSSNGNGNRNSDMRRFGVFEVDLRSGELRRNGMKVKIQEQPLQVLAHLLEHPGEVVTREDLRNHLWPADTFVDFDHSLNAAIRRLRDALGDSAENPTFVETVARRGYRFLAPITAAEGAGADGEIQSIATIPKRHPRWIPIAAAGVVLVFLGIVLGFHVAKRVSAPYRSTRLSANPVGDPVRAAAISTDGRYLAFSDDNGFYLRQIETGETHALTVPESMLVNAISWLPDSAHMIVALADANHKSSLWEISAMGGGARKVLDDGAVPAVSPNGRFIAYISGQPLHQRLWSAMISGEQPRVMAGEDSDLFGRIAWSPDGSRIAYTTAKSVYGYGATARIALTEFPGREPATAAPSTILSLAGLNAPLAWVDGRLIYSLQEERPRQVDTNLWSVRLDSRAKPVGPALRLTDDSGSVTTVGASGDGKRIIYAKHLPQPDVYVARIEHSALLQPPDRLTLDDREDMPYDWTLDNRAVIFISDRTGTFNIYKQSINETMPDLLVAGTNPAQIPRLSPDGTQILYLSYPNWGDPNYDVPLIRVPLAGGAPQTLLKAKWISNHQCARAPATLCLYSVITEKDLTFFSYDPWRGPGAQIYQIKDELPQAYNWSLSPDGTTLAIAKGKWNGGEEPVIRLISLKSGAERTLALQGYLGITSIDWAADSKGLWAVTSGEKENVLLHVDLQGNARPVWRPKNMLVGWAIPSRDGKYLALHIRSASGNVWMLERP
jgi:DNA-binding winged helix-turn-helix (wHTH) protein/Tol biopolymer transport system component